MKKHALGYLKVAIRFQYDSEKETPEQAWERIVENSDYHFSYTDDRGAEIQETEIQEDEFFE